MRQTMRIENIIYTEIGNRERDSRVYLRYTLLVRSEERGRELLNDSSKDVKVFTRVYDALKIFMTIYHLFESSENVQLFIKEEL